jgi:type 1 fimbriae regulatory protein FimB/type 1 fimbriae regulatory protein FimE
MQKVKSIKRDYLTLEEVKQLKEVAKNIGRYGKRDALIIQMSFAHGLRVSELIDLKWNDIDWTTGRIHIERLKNSDLSVQIIGGAELRELRAIHKGSRSPFIFTTERGGPMTRDNVNKLLTKCAKVANFDFPVHPHMLRHGCGYQLANNGVDTRTIQEYLGHKDIRNTVRYTKLNANKFKGIEKLFR